LEKTGGIEKGAEMATKKKAITGKSGVKKLKLKRETVRDLDAKGKSGGVKGGKRPRFPSDSPNC
jgi:hypothetical protein